MNKHFIEKETKIDNKLFLLFLFFFRFYFILFYLFIFYL